MKDSGFFVLAEKRKRLATLYTWNKDHLETTGGATDGFETEPGFASGGGGLVTTARDYARIGQMLLNHGTLDGVRVLSPSAAQAIMTDHLAPASVTGGYGIGFQHLRPGYKYGYNGVVVTDPAAANVALGRSYLWHGAAVTWFWVDPENQLVSSA